jgi:hypothetical protein
MTDDAAVRASHGHSYSALMKAVKTFLYLLKNLFIRLMRWTFSLHLHIPLFFFSPAPIHSSTLHLVLILILPTYRCFSRFEAMT